MLTLFISHKTPISVNVKGREINPSLSVNGGRPLLMHWLGLLTEVFFPWKKWAFDRLWPLESFHLKQLWSCAGTPRGSAGVHIGSLFANWASWGWSSHGLPPNWNTSHGMTLQWSWSFNYSTSWLWTKKAWEVDKCRLYGGEGGFSAWQPDTVTQGKITPVDCFLGTWPVWMGIV